MARTAPGGASPAAAPHCTPLQPLAPTPDPPVPGRAARLRGGRGSCSSSPSQGGGTGQSPAPSPMRPSSGSAPRGSHPSPGGGWCPLPLAPCVPPSTAPSPAARRGPGAGGRQGMASCPRERGWGRQRSGRGVLCPPPAPVPSCPLEQLQACLGQAGDSPWPHWGHAVPPRARGGWDGGPVTPWRDTPGVPVSPPGLAGGGCAAPGTSLSGSLSPPIPGCPPALAQGWQRGTDPVGGDMELSPPAP